MDWKIILTTFWTIFLAELGDKTQLATITMTAKTKKGFSVFLGAIIAFLVLTIIGTSFGEFITKILPAEYLEKIAASAFILIGILMLWGKI
ncbi:MAG: TMEM165/GDT1 family protein [bacterium]